MAGTKLGGKRAAETNKNKFGDDFYARIGSIGGKIGTTGGFAARIKCDCNWYEGDHVKAQCAGHKGGTISRRRKPVQVTETVARKNLIARLFRIG